MLHFIIFYFYCIFFGVTNFPCFFTSFLFLYSQKISHAQAIHMYLNIVCDYKYK